MAKMAKKRKQPTPKRFDDQTALEIRQKHLTDHLSYREIAKVYHCGHATVEHIVKGCGAYRHLGRCQSFRPQPSRYYW